MLTCSYTYIFTHTGSHFQVSGGGGMVKNIYPSWNMMLGNRNGKIFIPFEEYMPLYDLVLLGRGLPGFKRGRTGIGVDRYVFTDYF